MIWIEAHKKSDNKPIGHKQYCDKCGKLIQKYGEPDPEIKFDRGYFELANRYRHTERRCALFVEENEQTRLRINKIKELHGGGLKFE